MEMGHATAIVPLIPSCFGLECGDVRCLQSFGALGNIEFNSLSFVQGFATITLNRREVYEYILSRLPLNESKTFAGIEPLYCSLFFH